MNLHEYQGKSILKSFGVAIQEGKVADSPEAAHAAAVCRPQLHRAQQNHEEVRQEAQSGTEEDRSAF